MSKTFRKKSILLVNPYIEDFSAYDHFSKPLGIIWLASYLKEHFTVYFINVLNRLHSSVKKVKFKEDGRGDFPKQIIKTPECLSDIPLYYKRYGIAEEAFRKELLGLPEKPDYVFITTGMTYWYTGLSYTIKLIREVYPESKIFVGGIYASLLPSHAERVSGADVVVPYQNIGKVIGFLEKYFSLRFSKEVKMPSYDILGEYYYLPLMTSTGCIYKCSYCASSILNSFEQFNPENVFQWILVMNQDYGVKKIVFYDDALLYKSETHIDVILQKIIESSINVQFYTPNGLHIRFLSERTAQLMRKAGFVDIRLSLESSEERFQLESSGKATNIEFNRAIENLYRAGFERKNIRVYTLLNVPGQRESSIEKTMEYIYKSGAIPMLAYYSPIPGTLDFEKSRVITDVDEPLFQNNTVYLYRSGFNLEYLTYLKKKELQYRT